MSRAEAVAAPLRQRGLSPPIILLVGSIALYVGVALSTGQSMMLHLDGFVGLLQRMVGLGLVAVGQTFAILAGSIDLSVANLISVAAVLASFIMQGRPDMMLPAVAAVLAISAIVGLINGALISRLQVNPLIATLGVGLFLQGILSASFTNFAGSVPKEFQAVAYGTLGFAPFSVIGLFVLAFLGWLLLRATKFGAHLYAVGGNSEGARLARHSHGLRDDGRARALQRLRRFDRALSRKPPTLRRAMGRARRRLRPRIDRCRRHRGDGARRRPRRRLGHHRGRAAVRRARRLV